MQGAKGTFATIRKVEGLRAQLDLPIKLFPNLCHMSYIVQYSRPANLCISQYSTKIISRESGIRVPGLVRTRCPELLSAPARSYVLFIVSPVEPEANHCGFADLMSSNKSNPWHFNGLSSWSQDLGNSIFLQASVSNSKCNPKLFQV